MMLQLLHMEMRPAYFDYNVTTSPRGNENAYLCELLQLTRVEMRMLIFR
jgi:hypothetical protein